MHIFVCNRDWEAMLTCIYDAWNSHLGHTNIRLEFEPITQYSLFDEYHHVDADITKAEKVMDAINIKIGQRFYREIAYCAMAYESDVLDIIYRMVILGFVYGEKALEMVQYKEVMRYVSIRKRFGNEAHSFLEFLRFHELRKGLYIAHIEPKSRVVLAISPYFQDRMPSENWIIVDDVHMEATIHEANKEFYLYYLNKQEMAVMLESEQANDEYTDLWKIFFDSITIAERKNRRCQNNFIPIWKRKHAVEFLD